MVLLLDLLEEFDELKGLEACDGGGGGGHGWDDTASFEFDLQPVHLTQLVVLGPAVTHRAHEVNMVVRIIILFEFLWFDKQVLESLAALGLL